MQEEDIRKKPVVDKSVFLAPNAMVISRVTVKENASIWPGAVLRGDINTIHIGKNTNVQDNTTIHVGINNPTFVGDNVTIGHNCVIHGCTIKGNSIIGMGAVVLNGAVIEENCIIGAGAVIPEGKVIASGSLVLGVPGKVVRKLEPKDLEKIEHNWKEYVDLSRAYSQG